MPGKDASRPENSPPKATIPEPPQSGAPYTVRAAWVAKVIKWFVDGWTRALPGDGVDDDYRSDLIDAPCGLPKDFRYAALRLLPQAADEVIRLKSVLSWTSPDDANRLAVVIRVIESEIVGTDESADQGYDEIPLNKLRRLCIELENAKVRTPMEMAPGTGAQGRRKSSRNGEQQPPPAGQTPDVPRRITISTSAAVQKFHVSRTTLRRLVLAGALTDHRPEGCPSNQQFLLDEGELAARFQRKTTES